MDNKMKNFLLVFALVSTTASAQQLVITPQGNNVVTQSGSTTYVTGSRSTGVAVTPTVNPITGIGMVHTPNGSYIVQQSGSTTTVIQTSKGR
jgi:hypothetical protein